MNYEDWAEWYDVFYSSSWSRGVDFYVDLARTSGGPVLEIGVGTGRIAIPTAQAGVEVVGIDLHEPMLGAARVKLAAAGQIAGSLELIRADMRDFDIGRQFSLVTIPARTLLLAMTEEDQRRTLERATAHLAPDGRVAFNVFVPNPALISDTASEPFRFGETTNPATGRRCVLWAMNRFDTLAQTNEALQIVEELDEAGEVARRVELEVKLRYLYPGQVFEMLEASGLDIDSAYGDFRRSPFTEDSEELVLICRWAG